MPIRLLPSVARPKRGAPPTGVLHLSVDDVVESMRDLSGGDLTSVWHQPLFATLRRLHERYGAVFSLYLFFRDDGWDLRRVPAAFEEEFREASPWLRFGFHGMDATWDYGAPDVRPEDAAAHHDLVVSQIVRLAGAGAVDRMPRVHLFGGDRATVRAWRGAPLGIRGLLTPDDDRRRVYHLDGERRERLARDRWLRDDALALTLIPSVRRIESVPDVPAFLEALHRKGAGGGPAGDLLCLFTHEPNLADASVVRRMEEACAWAQQRGYAFGFPTEARPAR